MSSIISTFKVIRPRRRWAALVLWAAALTSIVDVRDSSAQSGTSQITFGTNITALVAWKGKAYEIYPDTKNYAGDNQSHPERWLFAMRPTLFVDIDSDGLPKVETIEWQRVRRNVSGGIEYLISTRLGLSFQLRSEPLMSAAAGRLTAVLKDSGHTFTAEQIMTIPISSIAVNFVDLGPSAACRLLNSSLAAGSSDTSVVAWLECTDRSRKGWPTELGSIHEFRQKLPFANVMFDFVYNAQQAQIKVASVQGRSIRNTNLHAKLAGKGSSEVIISRDELRNLAMSSSRDLFGEIRGANDPDMKSFVDQALSAARAETIDAKAFSDEMLKQTYNPKDISPDEINKTMDKNFEKGATEEQVNFATGGEAGALWGLFEGKGNASGSQLKKWMKEHNVEVEFNGTKWVVKSVDIVRVNVARLEEAFNQNLTKYEIDRSAGMPSERRALQIPLNKQE